jgi:ADP-ribose pyrophosphatase YjhB (NUDIX family)
MSDRLRSDSSTPAPPSALFLHCPSCGARRQGEIDAIRFCCDDCGFVYYYNVAVSAAVLIAADDGRVLFIRRAREPSKGKLALPGGFVDRAESAEQAALREVREEVGVRLERVEFLASFPNLYAYRGVEYPVVDLFFCGRVTAPSAARPLEDATEVAWAFPGALGEAELAFPSHARALERFLAIK